MSDTYIGAHVPAALAARLQRAARRDGRSVSSYLRRLLEGHLP